MPLEAEVGVAGARELALVLAVGAHEVDLVEARALRAERDRPAVRRPHGLLVVHARRPRERAHGAAVEARHADLRAVQVAARIEGVGHLRPVGRDGGVALVAMALEVPVVDREPARPRVADADDREPGAVVLLALDRDHEALVVDPHGTRPLGELARRAACARHEPDVVALPVGDRGPVRREPRHRVVPVGRGRAQRGEALDGASRHMDAEHVRGLGRRLDEDRQPAVAAEHDRMRPRRGGHRLEAPVRRRLQVLARLGEHALVLVLADPDRLRHVSQRGPPRVPRAPRARAVQSCPGRSRPPAPRRWGGAARRAGGRRHGSRSR